MKHLFAITVLVTLGAVLVSGYYAAVQVPPSPGRPGGAPVLMKVKLQPGASAEDSTGAGGAAVNDYYGGWGWDGGCYLRRKQCRRLYRYGGLGGWGWGGGFGGGHGGWGWGGPGFGYGGFGHGGFGHGGFGHGGFGHGGYGGFGDGWGWGGFGGYDGYYE